MQRLLFPRIGMLIGLSALVAGGGGVGCSSSVNFDSWRKDVETYVRDKGGGDPTVLRETDVDASHRGFKSFSKTRPSDSTDANGVLVGTTKLDGQQHQQQPWLVFLVGLVEKEHVKDIRVAALSVGANNKYTWHMGKKDDAATHAYIDYNKGLARRRFPDRKKEPPQYLGFPREEDRFELTPSESGDSIGVAHAPSGAKWHVRLTGKK
jgi:hypothetical protein